ncbi:O-methylsterigmatocystin oxidoreductase [Leucoagaricus sp. SymC.cos]|nr:O-methylsterigmatocystin oxidoreductase [Leucoagaricus sp. SymC.cos]
MSLSLSFIWLVLASGILLVLFLLRCSTLFTSAVHLPLPPGPAGHWFYGVKKMLPRKEPWKTYASWSRMYNVPIVSFRVYNRTIIVLNDAKSVSDLLEKRASIYSDRPAQYMSQTICGRSKTVFNISSQDPHHKIYRRLVQHGLGTRGTKTYSPILQEELANLLDNLVISPQDFVQHVRRNFVGVIMRVAYGYRINDLDDTFVNVAEETVKITDKTMANGSWLVDYYPIVRCIPSFLPGGEFKNKGKIWRERLRYLSDIPHQWVKQQMASGSYMESFTSEFLSQEGTVIDQEKEDVIRWSAGGLYVGASDTTVSAITSFILLMALHPEIQTRAQAEIDEICGQDQFPNTSQLELFTYLQAVLKEVLRFAPVGNLALPHKVIEEDEYMGYRIPKNATVMGNVWQVLPIILESPIIYHDSPSRAIMHDASLYPDPNIFSPERFLEKEKAQPDPRQWAFGFGRRACPGTHFAETSILLVMAGKPYPEITFTTGITRFALHSEL